MNQRKFYLAFLTVLILISFFSNSEEADDLPQKTVDPTASLPSIQIKNDNTYELWDADGSRSTVSLRVTNPFYAWEQHNLLSVYVPYTTGDGVNSGEGASQVFDLLIFNRPWGRFGVGLDANLRPPNAMGEGIQSGPAWGFVALHDKCNFGLLNLNFFSEHASLYALQLIAGCSIGNGWTVSSGNFTGTYNGRTNEWGQVPLSAQLGYVAKIAGQSVQFFVNPHYNTKQLEGADRWTLTTGITLVANPFQTTNSYNE